MSIGLAGFNKSLISGQWIGYQGSESLMRHIEQYKHPREPTSVEEVWFAGCHCGKHLRYPSTLTILALFLLKMLEAGRSKTVPDIP